MAELVVLGSGCGFATVDRFCTSIALLAGRHCYLFDCGEPCAALLFRQGIDPLSLKAAFISHMHPDHAGGLASLVFALYLPGRSSARKFRPWSVNRDDAWYRSALRFPPVDDAGSGASETRSQVHLLLPSEGIEPMQAYFSAMYLPPSLLPFDLDVRPVREGIAYEDELVRVCAAPNTHMSGNFAYDGLAEAHPHIRLESYSYGVEAEGHRFVFSGDITSLEELTPLLAEADTLIVEVAHVDPAEIGPFVRDLPLKHVVLTHIHPGLEDRLPGLLDLWADPRIVVAHDGFRLTLG